MKIKFSFESICEDSNKFVKIQSQYILSAGENSLDSWLIKEKSKIKIKGKNKKKEDEKETIQKMVNSIFIVCVGINWAWI